MRDFEGDGIPNDTKLHNGELMLNMNVKQLGPQWIAVSKIHNKTLNSTQFAFYLKRNKFSSWKQVLQTHEANEKKTEYIIDNDTNNNISHHEPDMNDLQFREEKSNTKQMSTMGVNTLNDLNQGQKISNKNDSFELTFTILEKFLRAPSKTINFLLRQGILKRNTGNRKSLSNQIHFYKQIIKYMFENNITVNENEMDCTIGEYFCPETGKTPIGLSKIRKISVKGWILPDCETLFTKEK